jgi:DNA invertase Pin-like site-specific DNA recombinase
MTTDKIAAHHLTRKAILYVRQSSAHQVLHNRESRNLQYAMRDRLTALGFADIETIDDDLGRSAAGGVTRAGFERMVAEVCLGKVGAVAAREVSLRAQQPRLATPDRDVPCRRYDSCRSGDCLRAPARQ